jgi:hypothetical protein
MMIVLSLAACLTQAAFAAETFSVNNEKAANLMNALSAAGAKVTAVPDASFLTVTSVDCTQGYLPGHGAYANCTFKEQIPVGGMSHAIFLKSFEVNGDQARTLINALEDAGVKAEQQIEMARFSADSIRCSSSFFGPIGPNGRFGRNCTLTISE